MQQEPQEQSFWRSPAGTVCLGFLLIGGFFLLTEHTAHVLGALPWLLILACPLMHLFMHPRAQSRSFRWFRRRPRR